MKKILVILLMHANLCALTQNDQKDPDTWRSKVFTHIYTTNHWKCTESFSGPGSTLDATLVLRSLLPGIVDALGITKLLDAGCGDFNWMKEVDLGLDMYVGADIVPDLIERNNKLFSNHQRCFLCVDITRDVLPKVDAVFCRDCLAHMSYQDVQNAIENFKQHGITYLIASNFPYLPENKRDIRTGDFRPINLQLAPFNFPQPIMFFEELSAEPAMKKARKHLCVWRVADL